MKWTKVNVQPKVELTCQNFKGKYLKFCFKNYKLGSHFGIFYASFEAISNFQYKFHIFPAKIRNFKLNSTGIT